MPDGPLTADLAESVVAAFHDEHRVLYGYDFRDDARQEVEWVNVRVTGVGPIRKPEAPAGRAGSWRRDRSDRQSVGPLRRLGRDRRLRPGRGSVPAM